MDSQTYEPKDLNILIEREINNFKAIHALYAQFVEVVKNECVMDNHFFTLNSLPELIVRKNYSRKDYEQITKLLVAVKNSYLEIRSKKEPENVDE